ncbi:MAG: hypothetical protein ABW061_08060 [Polyangiaceae bacterium]
MADEKDARQSTWTVISCAQGSGSDARAALGELIRRYENYVTAQIRRRGHPPDLSAEELKQQFFTEVLGREDIASLDRERTRNGFRAWLHVAVRRFLYNQWDKWHALSGGRDKTAAAGFDIWHTQTPEDLAASAFALDTLQHVLNRHEREAPNPQRFAILKRFLPGPHMDLSEQEDAAAALGLTRNALAKAVCDMRAKHRQLLREAVADTLELDPAATEAERAALIDRELIALYRCLSEAPVFEVRPVAL